MRLVWLCPYPLHILGSAVKANRQTFGHSAPWIVNLSGELADINNVDLHILTHSATVAHDQILEQNGITFHVFKYSIPFTSRGFPSYLPITRVFWFKGLVKKLLKRIDELQPDIVHAHGTEDVYGLVGVLCGSPGIVSIQGIINKLYAIEPSAKFFFQRKIENYVVKNGTNFGCRTEWDKAFVLSKNNKGRIFYLPEAITETFFDSQKSSGGDKEILFVGYLHWRKGIEVLFDAMQNVWKERPLTKVDIVGGFEANYKRKLESYIEDSKKSLVRWHGHQNPSFIADALNSCQVYVHPSMIDNSPNSLAEAMATGTACIASDVGGIPSMIENGHDGLLFKCGNPLDLSEKIMELLSDSNERMRLGNNARHTALIRNHPKSVVKETMDVYRKIKLNLE